MKCYILSSVLIMSETAIHLEKGDDLDDNFAAIMDMLTRGLKIHFVDAKHSCPDGYGFNILRTDSPSIKIITINDAMRPAIISMVNHFNNNENDNFNAPYAQFVEDARCFQLYN